MDGATDPVYIALNIVTEISKFHKLKKDESVNKLHHRCSVSVTSRFHRIWQCSKHVVVWALEMNRIEPFRFVSSVIFNYKILCSCATSNLRHKLPANQNNTQISSSHATKAAQTHEGHEVPGAVAAERKVPRVCW